MKEKTALYNKTSFAPYYYHVHIMEEGSDGHLIYTGKGRFCSSWDEAIDFAIAAGCSIMKKCSI